MRMRIAIFIMGIVLISCGDSGSIYKGKLYKGQLIFSEGTDISGLKFGQLSVSSVADIVKDIGEIENQEDFKRMNTWGETALEEIKNAPKSEQEAKKLRYMCDILEFIDIDFLERYTESSELRDLLSNSMTVKTAEYRDRVQYKFLPQVTYFFEFQINKNEPISFEQKKQTHEFLKVNCAKYRAIMELLEQNPFEKIERKPTSDKETIVIKNNIDIIKKFIKRADKACEPLPEEDKINIYSDAVCQILSLHPEQQILDSQFIYASLYTDVVDEIFSKSLVRLGIASSFNEKRAFFKKLSKSCPIYDSWMNYTRQRSLNHIKFFGIIDNADEKTNNSLKVPTLPYNNFKELEASMESFRYEWEEKQSKGSSDFLNWKVQKTCKILGDLDMDYANNKDFTKLYGIAKVNYKYGVEQPEDIKILLYSQLLAYYGNLLETGLLYNFKRDRGSISLRNGPRMRYNYKLKEQCSEQREKLMKICKRSYLKIDRKFFGY